MTPPFDVDQQLLARRLGIPAETLSRVLQRLRSDGVVAPATLPEGSPAAVTAAPVPGVERAGRAHRAPDAPPRRTRQPMAALAPARRVG